MCVEMLPGYTRTGLKLIFYQTNSEAHTCLIYDFHFIHNRRTCDCLEIYRFLHCGSGGPVGCSTLLQLYVCESFHMRIHPCEHYC